MAKSDTRDTHAQDSKVNAPGGADQPAKVDRFKKVSTESLLYKPELCKAQALIGFAIAHKAMPDGGSGPWSAIEIETTEETLACDFDGNVVKVGAGRTVLLPYTAKLQKVALYARHPNLVVEVSVQPAKKISIGGGKTMWEYEIGEDERSVRPRKGIERLSAGGGIARHALPAAGAIDTVGEEIPF